MNELERLLEDRIVREVAGEDGFWSHSAEDAYISAGKQLFQAGWHADSIIDFLSSLFHAAAGEFGG